MGGRTERGGSLLDMHLGSFRGLLRHQRRGAGVLESFLGSGHGCLSFGSQAFGWKAGFTTAPSRVRQVARTSSSSHLTASSLLPLSISVSTKAWRLRA